MKRMRLRSPRTKINQLARIVVFALAAICAQRYGIAQNMPLISGGVGFFTRTYGGSTVYYPYIKPVAVAPLGNHVLIETRGSIAEFFSPTPHDGYKASTFKTMDYLQGDVIAGPHLTIVTGEFLTPFGTFNERLTQIWNETLPDFPLTFGVGTMNTAVSVGGMARGSAFSNQHLSVSYAAYYSSNIASQYFGAERSSGGEGQFYLPEKGLELGASYGRSLHGTHENFEGTHLWWEPINSPFKFRSEFARAPHARGYWFEFDYRLSHFGGAESPLGRLEPIFRMQQEFR
jgi:hypothetical protein